MKVRVIRNSQGEPYLIRINLCYFKWPWSKLYLWGLKLHIILRSDDDRALHDHPWWFITWILCGGYKEYCKKTSVNPVTHESLTIETVSDQKVGSLLYRPSSWMHRVELENPAVTLVLTGPRIREWGFATEKGWMDWRTYHGVPKEVVADD